ncbi:MAG: DUF2905 domain-containing protein [Candidatus Levybacteria bacterium]|nr:DUF2905 domain-containing protein [Candidatus Levybacteria bacterium]
MLDIGRIILMFGLILVVFGLLLTYGPKIPFLGKLPGDIFYQKDEFTFYAPIATSILLSILITILANLFLRK